MILRNKKTGEIATEIDVSQDGESFWVLGKLPCMYNSLAELNEEWDDYHPAEPLIKDEKIRKVLKAWAEGYMATKVQYDAFWHGFRNRDATITVWEELPLEDNQTYTIAELCGEED